MKKSLFGLFLVLFSVSLSAQLELDDSATTVRFPRKQALLVNPISLCIGGFEVGYSAEFSKDKNLSFLLGYYTGENSVLYGEKNETSLITKYKNFEAIKFEAHYYFLKSKGYDMTFYFGPFVTLKTASIEIEKQLSQSNLNISSAYKARATAASGGLMASVRFYLDNAFILDVYGGGGFTVPIAGEHRDDIHLPVVFPLEKSINPKFGISFGILLDNFKKP